MHRSICLTAIAAAAAAAAAAVMTFVPFVSATETSEIERQQAAIRKAIPLIEKGSEGSAEHRTCFTCHSQAVPILALAAAKLRGFSIDEENFTKQLQHTAKHLKRGKKNYLEGKGQGGRVVTAGYALWALAAGGKKANEDTSAVTGYLLTHQSKQNYWSQSSKRPPSSGSHFTNTFLALQALKTFGTEEQQAKIAARSKQVQPWLLDTTPTETEDRVFRLRALTHVEVEETVLQTAIEQLVQTQREDGGWSQKDEMESDAYATATVLAGLLEAGKLPTDHDAIKRGIGYLLKTQLEDGSWHVVTRAKGFQKYFETGFPHGKDQFISTAASAWAILALVLTLPDEA